MGFNGIESIVITAHLYEAIWDKPKFRMFMLLVHIGILYNWSMEVNPQKKKIFW